VIVTWAPVPLTQNSNSAPLIGRPIYNTQIYMLDRQLRPVPVGVPGELCIGGVSLGRGYLNCPDLTAEKFVPDAFGPVPGMRLYRTGDLARYQEDGNIEFLGRIDDQVKVRGFRIELGEIETVLAEHPDVRTALVLVNEDSTNDKRLIAYVVPQLPADVAPDRSYELTSRLAQHLREKLPAYMVPAAFVLLEEMPLSPNGKLNRRLLPAPDENGLVASQTYVGPRTLTEQALVEIFKLVLKVESVGVYDNFFELGGHSILATQVVSRIREQFDAELPLRSFFSSPTVAGVAEIIDSSARSSGQGSPIKPVSRVGPFPLSFAQQRLWLTHQSSAGSTAHNTPVAIRLSGSLDVEVLRRALTQIVRRHEILRTTFAEIDGEPQQIIAAPSEVNLPLDDLSNFGVEEREAALRRRIDNAEPFDLSRGPLLKAEVLKMADEEHVLILNMHRIIADRWSSGVLVKEVGTLYGAFVAGRESPLAELPIQYADYAVWQREQMQGDVLEELLDYWRVQLAGAPSVLELPAVYSHTPEQMFIQSVPFALTAKLTEALKDISQREGATLFMTLLACWQLFLACYTGQDDIVVGSPIANRTRARVEDLIGLFANTLILRANVSGDLTFVELLRRVREVCLGAYAHQDLPFEVLAEELQSERRSPLYQVQFELREVPQEFNVPELKLSAIPIVLAEANVDLTLSMVESNGVLSGEFIYSQNLFSETILRMEQQWRVLLETIVDDPECPIAALAIATEEESAQLIESFNEELEV
jgi:acyl carrier protein